MENEIVWELVNQLKAVCQWIEESFEADEDRPQQLLESAHKAISRAESELAQERQKLKML